MQKIYFSHVNGFKNEKLYYQKVFQHYFSCHVNSFKNKKLCALPKSVSNDFQKIKKFSKFVH